MRNGITESEPRYLDVNDLAQQLGVAVQTIYRWRSEGIDMPRGFRVNGRVRWRQETVDAWVATQEARASQSSSG